MSSVIATGIINGDRHNDFCSHFEGHLVFPVVGVHKGVINFDKHTLPRSRGRNKGCIGASSAPICGGDRGLFNVGFTGGRYDRRVVLIRNGVSIVSLRRTNFYGIITPLNATFADRRTGLVSHCAGRVILVLSTSTTKRGTMGHTDRVLRGAKLAIEIIIVPGNGSPSRCVGTGNNSHFGTLLRNTIDSVRCGLLVTTGKVSMGSSSNHLGCLGLTTRVVTAASSMVTQSVCVNELYSGCNISHATLATEISRLHGGGIHIRGGTRVGRIVRPGFAGSSIGPSHEGSPGNATTRRAMVSVLLSRPSFCSCIGRGLPSSGVIANLGQQVCRLVYGALSRNEGLSVSIFTRGLVPTRINCLMSLRGDGGNKGAPGTMLGSYVRMVLRRGVLLGTSSLGRASIRS